MSRTLRVVLGSIYPLDEGGRRSGPAAVASSLARALGTCDDLDLHVVSCSPAVRHSHSEKRGNVTLHWLATFPRLYGVRSLTFDAWRVRRIYEHLQPDVIHAQGQSEYAFAARSEHRLVLTVHGLEYLIPSLSHTKEFSGVVGTYRRLSHKFLAERSLRKASAVVSIAGDYVPQVLGNRVKGKTIVCIDNPISDAFFAPPVGALADCPTILSIGHVCQRKNQLDLVAAYAGVVEALPSTRLVLVGGPAEPQYVARLRQDVNRRGLTDRITFVDSLDVQQMCAAYAEAWVVALASIHETAPGVLAEAMAVGRPVVATSVGGVPWMVREGETGHLVKPGDTDAMAARLIELLSDRERARSMGQAARETALQRFAADRVAKETIHVYRSVANQSTEERSSL